MSGSRIVLVASSYLPTLGGVQVVVATLADELSRRGHDVFIIANRYPRALPARETLGGIPVRRLLFLTPLLRQLRSGRLLLFAAGCAMFPLTLACLLWELWRRQPAVVNLHFVGAPAPFVAIAHRLLGFRLVVSLHGSDVTQLGSAEALERAAFRACIRRAAAVTAVSRALLERAVAAEPPLAGRGHVVYNGLPPQVDAAPPSAPVDLLAVGRLTREKGFDVLLRALAESPEAGSLMLIGDGPEMAALAALAKQLRIADRVKVVGRLSREAIGGALANCSLVVVPSRREGFGLAALEAMAHGKPVIASRVGGLPEVLQDADAVLVPPEDPAALGAAIAETRARLAAQPDFGARNRALASRFSIGRMADEYLQLYNSPAT